MAGRPKRTSEAAAEAAPLERAKAAAGSAVGQGDAQAERPGAADPFVSELRRAGLLPLLVLHILSEDRSYGNELMDRISRITAGALAVNPNTMYPLLRSLEAQGFVAGEWEHPERRSRRFYRITDEGLVELERLTEALAPRLDAVATAVELIRSKLLGARSEE